LVMFAAWSTVASMCVGFVSKLSNLLPPLFHLLHSSPASM
jgi:hypothetical protein